jgi:hypothetical protein
MHRNSNGSLQNRSAINRYGTIVLITAPSAVAIWFIFHGLYANLSKSEEAIAGGVDASTQMAINLGYGAMIGGTVAFGAVALWAGFHLIRALIRERELHRR